MSDLPGPWSGARRVASRSRATGSSLGKRVSPRVRVVRDKSTGSRVLVIQNAIYRCKQPVEAFVLQSMQGLHVLVQPVNMHPQSVSRCGGCFLDIAVALPGATSAERAPHEEVLAVFLRSDAYGGAPKTERLAVRPEAQRVTSGAAHVGGWDYWTAPWKRAAEDALDEMRSQVKDLW